jgi:S-(hydroxymethyl)glutathione dehydrogenase/alcohol dehydrogenase
MVEPGARLEIEELERDELGSTEVLVRVDASGVCHSDLTILREGMGGLAPVVLGHEGAGTVIAVGSEVDDLAPGDRVIGSFVPACGSCWSCGQGRTHFCEQLLPTALRSRWRRADGAPVWSMSGLGTFAEEVLVERMSLVRVETALPAEQLALIGCGAMTGIGAALNTAAVEPGSAVAVIGCGGVGQFVVQGARIAGASTIIAIDPLAAKREAALAHGATHALDPTEVRAVKEVQALTGGHGVDYAFEVVGAEETIVAAYRMCRPAGTAIAVGMPRAGSEVTLRAADLYATEKRLIGSFYGSGQVQRDFPRLVEMAETGALDLAGAITVRIALDDVNEAFAAMEAGTVVRSVILPS